MSTVKWANTTKQWFARRFVGSKLNLGPRTGVVCLHTTEGFGFPEYGGGESAPNMTGLPPINGKRGEWRQHFPDEMSSRALRNESGGVETNTMNTFQIELIGTCDSRYRKRWGSRVAGRDYVYWPDATEQQLKWLARVLADLHIRHGLKLTSSVRFLPYPDSYGANGVRLSFEGWKKYTGILGHQHVPENSHGDPGNIDIERLLKLAREHVARRKAKKK